MLQEFADDGRDGVGFRRSPNGLQISAGRESAAFALDYQHLDGVIGLDLGAELLQLLRDRKVDRIEGLGPVQRDGGDGAVDR